MQIALCAGADRYVIGWSDWMPRPRRKAGGGTAVIHRIVQKKAAAVQINLL
jgi:hypothetical protein